MTNNHRMQNLLSIKPIVAETHHFYAAPDPAPTQL
jgi:hypothetical protein